MAETFCSCPISCPTCGDPETAYVDCEFERCPLDDSEEI